ncbi:hypothetical protein LCGC14_0600720 [marine sediment metagenome]|uniref:Uncharacterized protein n=1 Tax=marine sediment metagenome TaxID=412755 RepID=A0A0F9TWN5_9ZZZZ
MTWSKPEQVIIKGLSDSVKTIETALVGNIETKEPGMIDDLRDTQKDVGYIKTKLRENKKQHLVLFGTLGVVVAVIVYTALGGSPATIVRWFGDVIAGRL